MIAELQVNEWDSPTVENDGERVFIHFGDVHLYMSRKQLDELEKEIKEAKEERKQPKLTRFAG